MIRSNRIPWAMNLMPIEERNCKLIMTSEEQPALRDNSVFSGTCNTLLVFIFQTAVFKGKPENLKNCKLHPPLKKK